MESRWRRRPGWAGRAKHTNLVVPEFALLFLGAILRRSICPRTKRHRSLRSIVPDAMLDSVRTKPPVIDVCFVARQIERRKKSRRETARSRIRATPDWYACPASPARPACASGFFHLGCGIDNTLLAARCGDQPSRKRFKPLLIRS